MSLTDGFDLSDPAADASGGPPHEPWTALRRHPPVRRCEPRDGLAAALANGEVGGQPMGPLETFGDYRITFTAGHDTTKNALAVGRYAQIQNPGQLAGEPDWTRASFVVRLEHLPIRYRIARGA